MKTGYERLLNDEEYSVYYIVNDEGIAQGGFVDEGYPRDSATYNTANYYSDKTVAENNARADELMRKLRRFAVEHNECELDWNYSTHKWFIYCNYSIRTLFVSDTSNTRSFGQIYFSSEEIAKQAIEEYRGELTWYFTKYQDHVVENNNVSSVQQSVGEWKICCDGYYPYCSVCNEKPQNRVMTKFCPNCGAKMNNSNKY